MSAVYLIRHGQASFGQEDYDRLSERGHLQAQVLGAALRGRLARVDLVATGTQRRHQETAAACLAELQPPGSPAPRVMAGLDEMDHTELLSRLDPRDTGGVPADPARAFQALFARAVARWTDGAHDAEYTESWPAFRRRSVAALDDIARVLARGATALVFTSGGPITAICQHLLGTPDRETFRLTWALVNAGVTKVLLTSSGPVLSTVNDHAHFEGERRELITYR
jgi:broad specificity phosphatase PhoE